jgi:hypothetical protein
MFYKILREKPIPQLPVTRTATHRYVPSFNLTSSPPVRVLLIVVKTWESASAKRDGGVDDPS